MEAPVPFQSLEWMDNYSDVEQNVHRMDETSVASGEGGLVVVMCERGRNFLSIDFKGFNAAFPPC